MSDVARALIPNQRELFDIPADVTYLNCASLSPQLRAVTAAGLQSVRAKASPWNYSAADWFDHAEPLRALFGRVVNADADSVALVPAASYGLAVAAANVPMRAGQTVLVIDREFPSNVYTWRELARRTGGVTRTVVREPGTTWTDAIVAAIDETVAVVATPNCHWTDGSVIDLVRVGEAARAVGASLVVDASQSAGAHPIDVRAVQPDFLVAVGYKWLMGPYSLGYLYAAPHWCEHGTPIEHSWMIRAGAEDFAQLVNYTDALRAGARRFDMGESSQFVLLPMATAALEQVVAWGVNGIAASIEPLTSRLASDVRALGCAVPDARVRHMLGVQISGGVPSSLVQRLAASRVYVSVRGDSIRVAPHLYNDAGDIDRFVSLLRDALATGD